MDEGRKIFTEDLNSEGLNVGAGVVPRLPEIGEPFDMKLIFQIAIVTPDMDTLLDNWSKLFRIDRSRIICKCTKDYYDRGEFDGFNYYGKPCRFFIKYYRVDMGGLDLEIIEPLDKTPGNPYSDFLKKNNGKSGIQHIACKIDDRTRFIRTMKRIGIIPMQCGTMGKTAADGTKKDFYFFDLLDYLGIICECGNVVVGPLASDPRAGNPEGLDVR